jgi:glycosyltransferase involved in cell wall biosynthesis
LYGQQDLIIAQTDYMHRRLLEELPTRLHGKLKTLPNPTNAERIRQLALEPMELNFSKQEQSAITLVWCGRLIPVKQPVLAVDALAAARERGLSVRMVMIGDGPLRQEILTRVHQLNMSDHILLTGNQENPYPFMRSAQLGLLTSKFEGFPNVLLEMMACGVSGIVATECTGSLGMSALPRVRVVDVHSAAALASAVAAHAKDMMQSSPEAYEEELAKRSPDAFLDSILSPS